jgi:hypothetical protein
MKDPNPTVPRQVGAPDDPGAPDAAPGGVDGRVGTLRGAGVELDARRVLPVVLGIIVVTLAVLVVVLTVAGLHSNGQINRLRGQGKSVTVTITGCLGLLGGSGSNAAGYSCHGVYELDGHAYHELLPGSTFYGPGARIPALAVPGDPALVSPLAVIDTQHASGSVFIAPAVLAGVLLALVALVLWRRGAGRRAKSGVSPG